MMAHDPRAVRTLCSTTLKTRTARLRIAFKRWLLRDCRSIKWVKLTGIQITLQACRTLNSLWRPKTQPWCPQAPGTLLTKSSRARNTWAILSSSETQWDPPKSTATRFKTKCWQTRDIHIGQLSRCSRAHQVTDQCLLKKWRNQTLHTSKLTHKFLRQWSLPRKAGHQLLPPIWRTGSTLCRAKKANSTGPDPITSSFQLCPRATPTSYLLWKDR